MSAPAPDPRDPIVAALVAERYAPPSWWATPGTNPAAITRHPELDDSETTCARRRRQLAADFAQLAATTDTALETA